MTRILAKAEIKLKRIFQLNFRKSVYNKTRVWNFNWEDSVVMRKLRFILALWAAKLTYRLLRLAGRSASHNPGAMAMKLCPAFMTLAPKAPLVIAVTGTNGKTTVSNMLTDALELTGQKAVSNRLGSNIAPGCVTAMVHSLSWTGRCRVDAVVYEVDERASRLILPYIHPDYLVVTNLFRDSLKRNAHPDYIFSVIDTYCPDDTTLILNADDLCSCRLKPGSRHVFYGIGPLPGDHTEPYNLIADYTLCPHCHSKLKFDYLRYHHIGHATCPVCGFESPRADYLVTRVDAERQRLTVRTGGQDEVYRLIHKAVFNLYNELTVIAMLRELGFTYERVSGIVDQIHVPDSRYNETTVGPVTVVQTLSKGQSAVSVSRTFELAMQKPGRKAIILAMDDPYDRQGSIDYEGWVYDVEYEQFAVDDVVQVVAAGPRCFDHKVRLLIAGVPEERIVCDPDEMSAIDKVQLSGVNSIYLLYECTIYEQSCKMKDKLIKRLEEV